MSEETRKYYAVVLREDVYDEIFRRNNEPDNDETLMEPCQAACAECGATVGEFRPDPWQEGRRHPRMVCPGCANRLAGEEN